MMISRPLSRDYWLYGRKESPIRQGQSAIALEGIRMSGFLVSLPTIVRIVALYMNWPRGAVDVVVIMLHGLSEDLAIALQFMAAMVCCRKALPSLFVFLLPVVVLLATIPPLIDLSVQMGGFARISRVEIRTTFHNFHQMSSSMVDRVFGPEFIVYLTLFLLLLVAGAKLLHGSLVRIGKQRLGDVMIWIATCVFMANFAMVSRYSLPRSSAYLAGNTMFTLEFDRVTMATNIFESPVHPTTLTDVIAPQESHSFLSSHDPGFPFWRQTLSYTGDKRFDLSINETRRPNVLLFNMESWGYQVTGSLIGKSENASLTPYFDAFAKQGILFESHFNPGMTTTNTIVSQLFGVKPKYDHNPPMEEHALTLSLWGLPQILQDHGYTCQFMSATDISWHNWDRFLRNNAFERTLGSDEVRDILTRHSIRIPDESEAWGIQDEFSLAALEFVIGDLAKSEKPYFIDWYSISSHDPFRLPRAETESKSSDHLLSGNKFDKAYMRAIKYSDRQLGEFLRRMNEKGMMTNTIVMITGDHGRLMGDASWSNLNYGEFASDPYSHVPLAIVPSNDLLAPNYRGLRIRDVSSHVDLMATCADMIRLFPFSQHGLGRSLMRQQHSGRKVIVDQPQPGFETVSVIDNNKKLVFDAEGQFCLAYNRTLGRTSSDYGKPIDCWNSNSSSLMSTELLWSKTVSSWTALGYKKTAFKPPKCSGNTVVGVSREN